MKNNLPNRIFSGYIPKAGHSHVQGIAVDEQRGFIYFSFTTMLLKTDLAVMVFATGDTDFSEEKRWLELLKENNDSKN